MNETSKNIQEAFDNASGRYRSVTSQLSRHGSDCCMSLVQLRAAMRTLERCDDEFRETLEAVVEEQLGKVEDAVALMVRMFDALPGIMDHHREDTADKVNVLVREFVALKTSMKDLHQINDPTVRKEVYDLTGGKCAYCDSEIKPDRTAVSSDERFCVEHVVPRSHGGPDNIANYVPSCQACNSAKGDRHVLTFIKRNLPNRIARAELKVVNGGEA